MKTLLFAAVMACGGGDVDVANPVDGTLLFSQNSKKVVQRFTDSTITHVAIVIHEGGKCLVYEAAPPKVRRLHITRYYKEIGLENLNRDDDEAKVRVWALPPNLAFDDGEVASMREYLNSQLGRRYSVRNFVRNKPGDGVHCAELAGNTINASGRNYLTATYKDDPATLLKILTPAYSRAFEVIITIDETAEEADTSWCERSWEKWHNFRRFCAWCCYETWTFCR